MTPVKGLALHHPDEVVLDSTGAVGDRDLLLADADDKLVSITKTGGLVRLRAVVRDGALTVTHRDGRCWSAVIELGDRVAVDLFGFREIRGRTVLGPWAELFSGFAGRPVRLVRTDARGDGSDVHPVTLLGDASVAELARQAGLRSVDARRFRMLLGFSGGAPHDEDGWRGSRLRVGEAVIEVGGPVPRCAATTRHPDEGDRDVPIVKLLKAYRGLAPNELGRGVNFGVYASVVVPGRVRVGDALLAAD